MRRIGSLFSGYGGLDIAAETFFDATTAWTCDIDPGASKILTHRYPDAPNLGDITAINWGQVEPVDILAGGWPCQPFSLAGKRKGQDDERALWPEVTRAVRTLRPHHIVLENVAAIATAGELGRATSDLAALGYVGQWRCLRAADIGAPHGRARIFIHATRPHAFSVGRGTERRHDWVRVEGLVPNAPHTNSIGLEGSEPQRLRDSQQQRTSHHSGTATDTENHRLTQLLIGGYETQRSRTASTSSPTSNTASDGRHEGWPESAGQLGGFDAALSSATLTDAEGAERRGTQPKHMGTPIGSATEPGERAGTPAYALSFGCDGRAPEPLRGQEERTVATRDSQINWGVYEPAVRRWEHTLGRLAPPPTETSPKGTQRLSPRFVEWMMGLPQGWVTDVSGLTRNAQLKALGNGVVPQQAFAALQMMGEPE